MARSPGLGTQQLRGFFAEAHELSFMRRLRLDGLFVKPASLFLVTQLPVSHGQEEEVEAVRAAAGDGLLGFEIASSNSPAR